MKQQIRKTIVAALLLCLAATAFTACTGKDAIGNPAASAVVGMNTGDISQAVAQ